LSEIEKMIHQFISIL